MPPVICKAPPYLSMKSRSFQIIAILLIAVALGAYWFLQSKPPPVPAPPAEATPVPQIESATPQPSTPVASTPPAATPAPAADAVPAPAAASAAEWENKIDKILRMESTPVDSAQALINLLPTLPAEGQAEAAQHIANLIEDKDFGRVMPLLKNPNLPEEVQDVLVTDLMNREDSVKLPAMLEVAKIPNHPYHEEALTDLQIFLDADYGNNWQKWEEATKAYLKEQAVEDAATK